MTQKSFSFEFPEFFKAADHHQLQTLDFHQFKQMMRELLVQPDVQLYFDLFKVPNESFISEEGYVRFLKEVQGVDTPEALEEELEFFRNANDSYKQTRQGLGVCLTLLGFNALLCSAANHLMSVKRQKVHQPLSYPLSDYWINSSHNTYLCGDQVVGRSAVGQYIDLLLSGCRCVELDCWNGPEGEPVLFHGLGGYQLSTRIPFRDVIRACKDYGFQVFRCRFCCFSELLKALLKAD
ncbi:phospholipase C delta 1, putative [Eimeria necatrix]|uniref:Phosphoinositide phospholipase C n=1 Tax=Eimeria necatrix TaxID=51315 RepID=U6MRS9_9EIME|nr:phospholipase C delta 1, putative [Eimeria necatrix]CDJ66922.1 phospholipase C delta 1, putative [Eimeria necatrix]